MRIGWLFCLVLLSCAESSGPAGGANDGGSGAGGTGTGGAGVGGSVSLGGNAGKTACDNLLLAAESAGPDDQFGTGDDVITHAERVHWGLEHVEWSLRTENAGPDGEWGTSDDQDGRLNVYAWKDGKLLTASSYDDPGPDDDWNTTDDVLYAVTSLEYTGETSGTQLQEFVGADHALGTADDSTAQWLALSLVPAPEGGGAVRVQSMLYHQQPGDDGAWQSGDDPVSFAQRHEYPSAELRKIYTAAAPGPDGQWLTADDDENNSIVSACNPSLGIATDKFYSPGPDGELDTSDDVLESQWYYRFDGCGASRCPTIIR